MKFFGLFVLLFVGFTQSPTISASQPSQLDFSYTPPVKTVGLPSAILVDSNGIWTGGENGLLEVRSGNLVDFTTQTTADVSSWVTDIDSLENDQIIVSVFGRGLYELNGKSLTITEINTDTIKLKGFWKTDVSEKYILASTLNDIAIFDSNSREFLFSLSERGIPVGSQVVDLFFDETLNRIWWVDSELGLFYYAFDSETWSIVDLGDEIGRIFTITATEDTIYVGGNGVVVVDKNDLQISWINSRTPPHADPQPVRSIFVDRDSKVWVAAEKLYLLNTEAKRLSPSQFLSGKGSDDDLLIITDMTQDERGNFFAVDTAHGLVVLSTLTNSVTEFVSPFDNEVIKAADFDDNTDTLILHSSGNTAVLAINEKSSPDSKISYDDAYKRVTRLGTDFVFTKSLKFYSLEGRKINALSFAPLLAKLDEAIFDSIYKTFLLGDKLFLVLELGGEKRLVDVSDINKPLLPYSISNSLLTDWNTLLVTVDSVGIFELNAKGELRQINFKISHDYQIFSSIYAQDDRILVGTSGSGFLYKDLSNDNVIHFNNDEKFIRDAVALDNYWLVASNSGLYALGKVHNEKIYIGKSFGIEDTDFDFDGISVSPNYVFLRGDKGSYVVKKGVFEESLLSLSSAVHSIDKSELSLFVNDGRTWNDFDENGNTLSPLMKIKVELSDLDYVVRELLFYEYKLEALQNDWIALSPKQSSFELDELPIGTHTLQIRVHDPRSYAEQPIANVQLTVLPPWWRTWQAMLSYCVIFFTILYIAYKYYLKRVDEQGALLSKMVEEKNSMIHDTNEFVQRMLARKQRALANLSHEIRTPLTLILGPLKQIVEEPNAKENAERINLATRNAQRIGVLVDQMLELEKLDYIKEQPKQLYHLDKDIPRIMYDLNAYAEMKGHKLNWQCSGQKKLWLYSDSLEKILSNLVSNAIKYTRDSGKIQVSIKQRELQLVIEVSDNGVGMTDDDMAKIFERYTRLDNKEEGVGVGLALVKELVSANDGHIKVSSEDGVGSCFTVFLPMLSTIESEQINEHRSYVSETAEPEYLLEADDSRKDKVILIVDDNEEMRGFVSSLLSEHYRCLLARDGRHALKVAKKVRPDLILTDFKMPDMDGLALTKALRDTEHQPYIPIIFMSAFGDQQSIKEALEVGVDSYLTKPIDKSVLLLRIRNLFERQQPIHIEVTEDEVSELSDDLPDFDSEQKQNFYFKALDILESHYSDESFSKPEFASMMAMSDRHLLRNFREVFDKPFNEVLREFRLEKARSMLLEGTQITQVVYDTGFSSPSHFSRAFKDFYQITPSQYQKENYRFKRKA